MQFVMGSVALSTVANSDSGAVFDEELLASLNSMSAKFRSSEKVSTVGAVKAAIFGAENSPMRAKSVKAAIFGAANSPMRASPDAAEVARTSFSSGDVEAWRDRIDSSLLNRMCSGANFDDSKGAHSETCRLHPYVEPNWVC